MEWGITQAALVAAFGGQVDENKEGVGIPHNQQVHGTLNIPLGGDADAGDSNYCVRLELDHLPFEIVLAIGRLLNPLEQLDLPT